LKTVHFVRHGETEQNKDGIWQGHTNTQLSKTGKAQAKLLSKRINLKNQTVFTSDLARAKEKNVKIHLPSDVVCAKEFSNDAETKNFDIYNIPDDYEGMDAGKNSIEAFRKVVLDSKTILWNGPVGVFEFSNYSNGTKSVGDAVARSTENGAFSLVGGGDSVAAVKKFNLQNKVSYVSTGGGAMLESLEGKKLPGISALEN